MIGIDNQIRMSMMPAPEEMLRIIGLGDVGVVEGEETSHFVPSSCNGD